MMASVQWTAGQVDVSLPGYLNFFVNVLCRSLLLLAAVSQNSSNKKPWRSLCVLCHFAVRFAVSYQMGRLNPEAKGG